MWCVCSHNDTRNLADVTEEYKKLCGLAFINTPTLYTVYYWSMHFVSSNLEFNFETMTSFLCAVKLLVPEIFSSQSVIEWNKYWSINQNRDWRNRYFVSVTIFLEWLKAKCCVCSMYSMRQMEIPHLVNPWLMKFTYLSLSSDKDKNFIAKPQENESCATWLFIWR